MRARALLLCTLTAALTLAPAAHATAPAAASATPTPTTAPAVVPAAPPTAPLSDPTVAASPAPAVPVAPAPVSPLSGPSAGNLMQTIFALTLVLGLLFGLAWFMKRYGPKAAGNSAHLRTVGALNLGGRERIIVVEVGDQWIVVGASPGRVNALATMPKQESLGAPGAATLSEHTPSASSFSEWLKQTIDKRNAK